MSSKVVIATFVTADHADAVRQAIGAAGAGKIGEYTYCSYTITGKGRYVPSAKADPYIGEPNKLAEINEERIEVVCDRANAGQVVAALKAAHPYEEQVVYVFPILSEEEL